MKKELPEGRTVVATGNEAAAYAALLSRVQVIPAYPITPQTVVVERLAEMTAGDEHIIYKNMESEHAMLGYASRASKLERTNTHGYSRSQSKCCRPVKSRTRS